MQGQQCLRLLWLSTNKLLPEKTIAERQKLEQGHDFEEYAHKLFPEAENLADLEFEENLEKTTENLKNNLLIKREVNDYRKENGFNQFAISSSTFITTLYICSSCRPATMQHPPAPQTSLLSPAHPFSFSRSSPTPLLVYTPPVRSH